MEFEYTPLPQRAAQAIQGFIPPKERIEERMVYFGSVNVRSEDKDGGTEVLDGVTFTHHFATAPGDYEVVRWHYVETGLDGGETVVFLHGIPDSWYVWHHQMAALSSSHRCIAVDLKGYGQSEKTAGDYRHEGAAEQLFTMLHTIGVRSFNIVSHDRGTAQADFIVASHPENVLRYGRGEQHLYHFNPELAPQEHLFRESPWTGMMEDPKRFVLWCYTWVTSRPIPDEIISRVIQEFSYPGISHAVPRYFNSSTFRQEWLTRRRKLLESWKCPILMLQGYDSKTQPREFYDKLHDYIPNSPNVDVRFMEGGHFWALESPQETTDAIRHLLSM